MQPKYFNMKKDPGSCSSLCRAIDFFMKTEKKNLSDSQIQGNKYLAEWWIWSHKSIARLDQQS